MKKILAIAIATAFAAPAFAATSNVDVYGKLHMSVDSVDDGVSRGTNVSSNSSRIGFKGAEDLGGGLKAIWQAETTLDIDSNTTLSSARDSFLGLQGGWGTARLGYFDTPTKQLSRKIDLFNEQIGDSRSLLRSRNANGNGGNAWEERFRNSIAYDTPSFGGLSFSAQYSTQTGTTSANNNSTDAYSVSGEYKNGPLFLGAAYQSNNLNTVDAESESNLRVGAGFNMGDLKLVALYSKSADQRGVSGADRDIWGAGAAYKLGNGQIKAQYYKASDEDGSADTGAKMFAVGYDYNLSKRTMAYLAYAKTTNDANGQFSMTGGGHGDLLVPAAGNDPEGFSLGMIHKF